MQISRNKESWFTQLISLSLWLLLSPTFTCIYTIWKVARNDYFLFQIIWCSRMSCAQFLYNQMETMNVNKFSAVYWSVSRSHRWDRVAQQTLISKGFLWKVIASVDNYRAQIFLVIFLSCTEDFVKQFSLNNSQKSSVLKCPFKSRWQYMERMWCMLLNPLQQSISKKSAN